MKSKPYRKKSPRKPAGASAAPLATSEQQTAAQATLVLQDILRELPRLLAVAVVDAQSGQSLAEHSNSSAIRFDIAGAFQAEMIRQKRAVLQAQQLDTEQIEDIFITLTNQLHLLQLTDGGQQFIYLVVDKHDTNLAMARMVLRTHVGNLQRATASAPGSLA